MVPDKLNRLWLLAAAILVLIILISSLTIWLGRDKGEKVIALTKIDDPAVPQNILIDGAVANPGSYPLKENDTIRDLLGAAGGPNQNADLSNITIVVPPTGVTCTSQKVDINRADIWLLQALPGIGEVRAQSIIDFRSLNGPFKAINDIMRVPGLNQSTFEKIKDLITVSK
jgi:competence protein ComEA